MGAKISRRTLTYEDVEASEMWRYEDLFPENKSQSSYSDGSSSNPSSAPYVDSGMESTLYASDGTVRSTYRSNDETFDYFDARSLIQAYRPLIIRTIQAVEILEYIPDLVFEDVERIKSLQLYSPPRAAEVLLDKLEPYHSEQSWRAFLNALVHSEYTYLYDLLTRRTEKHHLASAELLRLLRPELRERIHPPMFIDLVFERELINAYDKSEIEATLRMNGEIAAAGAVLDRICKRRADWDNVFTDVLVKCDMHDLADLFKMIQHPVTNSLQGETKLPRRHLSRYSHDQAREVVRANASQQPHNGKVCVEREIAEIKRYLIDLRREIRGEAMVQSNQMKTFSEALSRMENLLANGNCMYEDDCNPYHTIAYD